MRLGRRRLVKGAFLDPGNLQGELCQLRDLEKNLEKGKEKALHSAAKAREESA